MRAQRRGWKSQVVSEKRLESSLTDALGMAVLTVSDTRSLDTDRSGALLAEHLQAAGHRLLVRELVRDDRYRLRALVAAWIADPLIEVILITGGTGLADRDITPEAVLPLLDKQIEGFGELFRSLSYEEVGVATLQSRALAGLANHTLVCCLPGSPTACRLAWERILEPQLDSRYRPCNFVQAIRARGSPASISE